MRLDPKVSIPKIIPQARTKDLRLATIQDWAGGMLGHALEQSDGVIFQRLKIAVVNEAGAGRLRRLQALRHSPFLSSEPERYLRMSQATSKGTGKGGTLRDNSAATWGIIASRSRVHGRHRIRKDMAHTVQELRVAAIAVNPAPPWQPLLWRGWLKIKGIQSVERDRQIRKML